MSWPEQWRRLAARIEGLTEASDFMLRTLQTDRSDPGTVVRNTVFPELSRLKDELAAFRRDYGTQLPDNASQTVDDFLGKWNLPTTMNQGHELEILQQIAPLGVFRAAFQFAADDAEAEAKNIAELAFEHLRRLLVVDEAERQKWQIAFAAGETRCEMLGAVHLLSHGIWAFKASGSGAATDLVFSEPLHKEASTIERTARALALTEWKVVRSSEERETKAAEARAQAKLYAGGLLAGVVLKSVRYIVLVSEEDMEPPADQHEASVTYRHIVLPVDPRTPSRQSRRTPHNQPPAPDG